MLGSVFGSAIGDCLGVVGEFNLSITLHYDFCLPLDILWSKMNRDYSRTMFMNGSGTDDTDQSVFIMRSFSQGKPNVKTFAKNIYSWYNHGNIEHFDEFCSDCGITTQKSINSPGFLNDPINAAKSVLTENSVGNGSAMRTCSIGCYYFWDDQEVMKNAKLFSSATYPHEWCVFGSVYIFFIDCKIHSKKSGNDK